jgi:hypothetical protein
VLVSAKNGIEIVPYQPYLVIARQIIPSATIEKGLNDGIDTVVKKTPIPSAIIPNTISIAKSRILYFLKLINLILSNVFSARQK